MIKYRSDLNINKFRIYLNFAIFGTDLNSTNFTKIRTDLNII